MRFPQSVADEVLVKCGRHCCLCGEFAGVAMELHHIKPQADGGDNTAENCIPLCCNCHAKVRAYDSRHPKGRKITEQELKMHRDKTYALYSGEKNAGLFVAVMIILMAYELIKDSIGKILHPELPKFSILVAVILVVSIGVKIYMYFYNGSIGRKIESAAMIATAKDSLSDTFSTMVVLASALAAHFWKIPIDGYCGFLVGVMILIAGITAMKDTVSPLLGQAPEPELVDEIEKIVRCDKRILGIHDLVVHDYGPGRLMVSLHAEVPYKEDILELHDLIDQIEFSLRKKLNCEPVIHMDPIVDDDEETNAVKARITEIIESLNKDSRKNENVQFHDFRMVKGSTHSNLIFDVVLPHGYQMSEEQIISYIKEKVSEYNKNYYCVIHIDRAYVK